MELQHKFIEMNLCWLQVVLLYYTKFEIKEIVKVKLEVIY